MNKMKNSIIQNIVKKVPSMQVVKIYRKLMQHSTYYCIKNLKSTLTWVFGIFAFRPAI